MGLTWFGAVDVALSTSALSVGLYGLFCAKVSDCAGLYFMSRFLTEPCSLMLTVRLLQHLEGMEILSHEMRPGKVCAAPSSIRSSLKYKMSQGQPLRFNHFAALRIFSLSFVANHES